MTRDQIIISQTVCFYLHPETLWLTWATVCTYRVQTFNFFRTGTISFILSAFENWKFKHSLTKIIARWMTWQDFSLKRKHYYILSYVVILKIESRNRTEQNRTKQNRTKLYWLSGCTIQHMRLYILIKHKSHRNTRCVHNLAGTPPWRNKVLHEPN